MSQIRALLIGGPHGGRWVAPGAYQDILTPPPLPFAFESEPVRYAPCRFLGGGWRVSIWLWVWSGYPRRPDGAPDVPRSHLPAWAQAAPESSHLCEVCRRRPMPGFSLCHDCWTGGA